METVLSSATKCFRYYLFLGFHSLIKKKKMEPLLLQLWPVVFLSSFDHHCKRPNCWINYLLIGILISACLSPTQPFLLQELHEATFNSLSSKGKCTVFKCFGGITLSSLHLVDVCLIHGGPRMGSIFWILSVILGTKWENPLVQFAAHVAIVIVLDAVLLFAAQVQAKRMKSTGECRHRFRYPSHAKRALYHLS